LRIWDYSGGSRDVIVDVAGSRQQNVTYRRTFAVTAEDPAAMQFSGVPEMSSNLWDSASRMHPDTSAEAAPQHPAALSAANCYNKFIGNSYAARKGMEAA